MEKIISLFQRNYDTDHLVRDELVPGAEWVAAGEGIATQKFDGTSCQWYKGRLWKRYEVRPDRPVPPLFVPTNTDLVTGKIVGWMPVGNGPEDQWHREACRGFAYLWAASSRLVDMVPLMEGQTYELCGPKVQGNPEGMATHVLLLHGSRVLHNAPRTFAELPEYFRTNDMEGIVWWHCDGRRVKIKAKDFGIRRRGA